MLLNSLIFLFFTASLATEALSAFEPANPAVPSALDTCTSRRSTYDILRVCITTTFLCAWVSIHPNARHKLPGTWEILGQGVRLFLLTVIVPEIVVGWAWMERGAAKRIKKEFKEKGFKISMAYAHLIHMNGFALCFLERTEQEVFGFGMENEQRNLTTNDPQRTRDDAGAQVNINHDQSVRDGERNEAMNRDAIEQVARSDAGGNAQQTSGYTMDRNLTTHEQNPQQVPNTDIERNEQEVSINILDQDEYVKLRYIETLSPDRFLELLENSSINFPKITKCELQDRSKRDGLGRLVTAVQALWFVLQIIFRAHQKLGITEIEITTLALASLNGYMLWLWRDKPQYVGVQVPVYLRRGSEAWEKNQGKWDEYQIELDKMKEKLKMEMRQKTEEKQLPRWHRWLRILGRGLAKLGRFPITAENWKTFWLGFIGRSGDRALPNQEFDSFQHNILRRALEVPFRPLASIIWPSIEGISETDLRSRRGWVRLALLSIQLVSGIIVVVYFSIYFVLFFIGSPLVLLLLKSHRISKLIYAHLVNEADSRQYRNDISRYGIRVGLIGSVFGALHFAAIKFPFPTTIEFSLWVYSSSVLTIYSTIFMIPFGTTPPPGEDIASSFPFWFFDTSINATFFTIYILSRFCIIVLALMTLRMQPPTAYVAVCWSALFPHASS